jgi:hypothetical protein
MESTMITTRLFLSISILAFAAGSVSAQTNTTQNSQTGVGNVANVDNTASGNVGNSSTIIQNGNSNTATVFQRELYNRSFIQQAGNFNEAVHQQSGNSNSADSRASGDRLKTAVAQVGNSNSANVAQVGASNISTVRQGYVLDTEFPAGQFRPADQNAASVDQNGYGLSSEVGQRGASVSAPAANANVAFVYQRSSMSTTSSQQLSRIIQESRGNYAEAFQYVGSPDAPNSSTITQRNSRGTDGTAASSNWASAAQEGAGHTTVITQDGNRNSSTVRMQGGGTVSEAANRVDVNQSGSDLVAAYRVRPLVSGGASGNTGTIEQAGNSHTATVYQFGIGDRASVSQVNGNAPSTYASGEVAKADSFVSQNARGNTVTVRQTGDNLADVTQAFGEKNVTVIDQVDAGDLGGARSRNSAIISQYGISNAIVSSQNAMASSSTAWQKVGSSNNAVTIGQGTGGTALESTTSIVGFGAGPQGAGSAQLKTDVVQAGSRNRATLYQDGNALTSAVTQEGSGTSSFANVVFVSQTGSGNSAIAYQGSAVGPSSAGDPKSGNSSAENGGAAADEFYFAGGARSAEIAILQTSSGNRASVYQYGRGQLARIEQSGANNEAGILQDINATNATAVIRQSGSDNRYFIQQVLAGQYVVVSQTGANNVATNVQRGEEGGSSGFTPPPGFPGY